MDERSCGGAANAAEFVERQRVMLWPSDLSSNSNLCSPQFGKAIAGGRDRALCPTLVHLDACRVGVGAVKEWRVALRQANHRRRRTFEGFPRRTISPPCSKTSLVIDRPLAIAWAERHQGGRIPELSVMVADRAQVEPQNAL